MRVVLDTNVVVSAIIATGPPRSILDRWLSDHPFEIIVCPELLAEWREVLARDKIRAMVSEEESQAIIDRLAGEAEHHPDPRPIPPISRDPDDDYILALAEEAGANGIVSGDDDMKASQPEVPIWTPREFVDLLDSLH